MQSLCSGCRLSVLVQTWWRRILEAKPVTSHWAENQNLLQNEWQKTILPNYNSLWIRNLFHSHNTRQLHVTFCLIPSTVKLFIQMIYVSKAGSASHDTFMVHTYIICIKLIGKIENILIRLSIKILTIWWDANIINQ